jgi:hypothetical protein
VVEVGPPALEFSDTAVGDPVAAASVTEDSTADFVVADEDATVALEDKVVEEGSAEPVDAVPTLELPEGRGIAPPRTIEPALPDKSPYEYDPAGLVFSIVRD